jgi:hydroxymethylpyrimidine pyrophosphatase-like HAD family hydrolase
MNAKVNKGKSLEIVARHLDVPMEQVLAVGDSWNDAPLLQAAGFGVAMGSAPAELREIADAVVADVENDGVAEALERFVLA